MPTLKQGPLGDWNSIVGRLAVLSFGGEGPHNPDLDEGTNILDAILQQMRDDALAERARLLRSD